VNAEGWIVLVGAFAVGACLGSFLNVVAYRLPRGLSFVAPRSACPTCGEPIAARDNVPLWSFCRLLGQCRACGQPIPWRYVAMEALMAVLTTVVAAQQLRPPTLDGFLAALAAITFVGGLVVVALVDLERRIIPDGLSKPGILVGAIASVLAPGLHPALYDVTGLPAVDVLLDSAVGAATAALVLWGVARLAAVVFRQEALGLGDVKLVAAMGAFLGLAGVGLAALAAVVVGTVVGLVLLVVFRSRYLPFGPFLALGGVLVALWPRGVLAALQWWSAFVGSLVGLPGAPGA
jgi:leader peptidase (prepilin peptidase)/N-methyltransferase